VIASVLKDPPSPLPEDVPPEFARIIMHCLEKEPADRFASAAELREALQIPVEDRRSRLSGQAGLPVLHTRVIVLPFRMLRRDDDLEFLAYALPDAIVGSLAGIGSLVVRSSLTASQYGSGS